MKPRAIEYVFGGLSENALHFFQGFSRGRRNKNEAEFIARQRKRKKKLLLILSLEHLHEYMNEMKWAGKKNWSNLFALRVVGIYV